MIDDTASVEGTTAVLKALASERRLTILSWLADPTAHFPPQRDGDLLEDGVCVGLITDKIGLSQPTVTSHMQALAAVGLVEGKKIKNWVFYKLMPEPLAIASDVLNGLLESQTVPSRDE